MTDEIWKDVSGFEGLYEVSNLGRVRSLTFRNRHSIKNVMRIMRATPNGGGYMRVCLSKGNAKKTVSVHRIVLQAFSGDCPPGMEAAHVNGNPADNRIENLRWATKHQNNVLDKQLHGTYIPSKPRQKLTNAEKIAALTARCAELEKALRQIATVDYANAATNCAAYDAVQIAKSVL